MPFLSITIIDKFWNFFLLLFHFFLHTMFQNKEIFKIYKTEINYRIFIDCFSNKYNCFYEINFHWMILRIKNF